VTTSVETPTWEEAFAGHYWRLGPETKDAIVDLLPENWSFEGKRVLDFGCGPGRTLANFLSEAKSAEIWGVDIDASSIELLRREHCPPLHVQRCGFEPPLDFEEGSFDLAWAISVFTHLSETSLAWLLELHRVLKPGGLLIATYMGRSHSELLTGEPWNENAVGMTVLKHHQPFEEGGPLVLMSDWWVRAHWGRAFEILHVKPQIHNQTWALMRRRDGRPKVEDLARPADDPREYIGVYTNLRYVQRELEAAQAELQQARRQQTSTLNDVRNEYEDSLSWRITRPLREGRRLARSLRSRGARSR
jgi:SAM-dependent methyltransferase